MSVRIEKSERLIRISGDREEILPLTEILKYTKLHQNYDPVMGMVVSSEKRRLYEWDGEDRLITGVGLLDRVVDFLSRRNVQVQVVDLRKRKLEPDLSVLDEFEFRPGQREVVEEILKHERCLVCCPTAYGKSYLFSVLVRAFLDSARSIHIITRRIPVADTLVGYLRSQGITDVGAFHSRSRQENRKVLVATIGSVHNLNPDADLILADEVHELATDLSICQLTRYRPLRAYGFTATPRRMDRAHIELEAIFGPLKVDISYQEAAQLGNVASISVIWIPFHHEVEWSAALDGVAFKRRAIWANEERNMVIADAARKFFCGGENQTMVSVETVEHAIRLKKYLPEFELVYSQVSPSVYRRLSSIGLADDESLKRTPELNEKLRRDFEKGKLRGVIATRIWSTGVSFNQLTVVVRADGTASEILNTQIPGRVARVSRGKRSGIVVDIMDTGDRNMYGRYLARRRNYESHGWEQLVLDRKAGLVRASR